MNAREKFHAQVKRTLEGKTDAERSEAMLLHDRWRDGRHYAPGDVVRFEDGLLYRCLIAHDSQANWAPGSAPSLWTKVMFREGVRIIPDVIAAEQAFAKGERGWWGDALYRSLIDANVWTPEAYPQGWELVAG